MPRAKSAKPAKPAKTRKSPAKARDPVTVEPVRRFGEDGRGEAMRLLAEGLPVVDVAEACGVDEKTVRRWKSSPEGYQQLAAARKAREAVYRDVAADGVRKIREAVDKAIDVLVEQLDHRDPEVRSLAARTLLDRGGIPRTLRTENANGTGFDYSKLSPEELRAVREAQRKVQTN